MKLYEPNAQNCNMCKIRIKKCHWFFFIAILLYCFNIFYKLKKLNMEQRKYFIFIFKFTFIFIFTHFLFFIFFPFFVFPFFPVPHSLSYLDSYFNPFYFHHSLFWVSIRRLTPRGSIWTSSTTTRVFLRNLLLRSLMRMGFPTRPSLSLCSELRAVFGVAPLHLPKGS